MRRSAAPVLMAGLFTLYSGDNIGDSRIEAMTDRGPILELIVRCAEGAAVISYSKLEKLYCTPKWTCDQSFEAVLRRTCG